MKKIALIILVYLALCFGICVGIANLMGNVPPLLANARTGYLFFRTVLIFFTLLPALLCSAFLVAASISFGHSEGKALVRFSPLLFRHYRKVMLASFCMVFILALVKEIGVPAIKARQTAAELAPRLLSEYVTLGEHFFVQGNDALAHEYARAALNIDPANEKALSLVDETEKRLNQIPPVDTGTKDLPQEDIGYAYQEVQNETVASLIEKAQEAAGKEEWFNAHYYAQLAVSLGTGRDINLPDARRLAAEAWNHLSDPRMSEDSAVWHFFAEKKRAYFALMSGNNVEAYYQFLELSRKQAENAFDPDIKNFLQVAEARLESECFFIDETISLQRFESAQNIYFTISHQNGVKDVVYFRGITQVRNTGGMLTYLRGFTMFTYGRDGRLVRTITTPYAKMVAEPVSALSSEIRQTADIKDEFRLVPALQLKSVERDWRGTVNAPVYTYSDFVPEAERPEYSYLLLSLPFNDFMHACDISLGADRMNLLSLMKISSSVHDFGFSSEIFTTALVRRLMYPLILLILFVFCASFAWNYRLAPDQLFKFKWIFVLPFASFLLYLIIEALLFMSNLACYALISIAGSWTLAVALCIALALLFAVSAIFLARTSD